MPNTRIATNSGWFHPHIGFGFRKTCPLIMYHTFFVEKNEVFLIWLLNLSCGHFLHILVVSQPEFKLCNRLYQGAINKFIGSTNQSAITTTRKNMSFSPLGTNIKFFHDFLNFHRVHKVLQPNAIFNKYSLDFFMSKCLQVS